jgi:hypothetical protein
MLKLNFLVILLLSWSTFLGCQDSGTKAKDTVTEKPVGKVSVPKAPTPYTGRPRRAPRLERSFPPPAENEALPDEEVAGSSKEKPELSDSKEWEPDNSMEYEPRASHEPESKDSVVEEPSDSRMEPPTASRNGV